MFIVIYIFWVRFSCCL